PASTSACRASCARRRPRPPLRRLPCRGAGCVELRSSLGSCLLRNKLVAMRSALKAVVEGLLAHGGAATLARAARRGGALVLAYHNILPDGVPATGDRSLHLARARF